MEPIAYVSRTETFSACHRLNSAKLSPEKNKELYGKCNNPNGHGHNYRVTVTAKGKISEDTGMVISVDDLKTYMKLAIMDAMDHKHLDLDVPYFKDTVSTVENISVVIWNCLTQCFPDPTLLYEVKVEETDKNVAYYRGEYASSPK